MPSVKFVGVEDPANGTEEVHVAPIGKGDEDVVLVLGDEKPSEVSNAQLKQIKELNGLKFEVSGSGSKADS